MDDENVVNVSENEANENENEFITNSFTERGEDDINLDVGNDSRKQERAGERNDKSYSQLGEKSDYNIYNPAIIEDISFQLSRTTPNVENNVTSYTLNVGDFYPITVVANQTGGSNHMASISINQVNFFSSDVSKAYVRDGVLYAVGATEDEEEVEITGVVYAKDENGNMIAHTNTISKITII